MEEQETLNPLVVRCPNCGAQQHYDLKKEQFVCSYCGTTQETVAQSVEFAHWKKLQQAIVLEGSSRAKAFACPSCGARVMAVTDEANQQCPFCHNMVVSSNFEGADLPQVIVPFKLTLEEATQKLKTWIVNNEDHNPAAPILKKNLSQLTACYLPYHIIRGLSKGTMDIGSEMTFQAYTDATLVNASNDLENLFLDGMEPFQLEAARAFDFNFLTHQKAKIQNVNPVVMAQRLNAEALNEVHDTLSKRFHTNEIDLKMNQGAHESVSTLLPVFVLRCDDGTMAAVNGQTGKVSVTQGKMVNKTRNWWIWPTLATIELAILGAILGSSSNEFGHAGGLLGALLFSLVFGGLAFIIASVRHKEVPTLAVYTSDENTPRQPNTRVEFFENFGNGLEPVTIKFMTLGRLSKLILGTMLITFLPIWIVMVIKLISHQDVFDFQFGYAIIWLVVPVFFIILALAGGVTKVYHHPMFYKTMPDGKLKRYRKQSRGQIWKNVFSQLFKDRKTGFAILGISLFLLISSVIALLFA